MGKIEFDSNNYIEFRLTNWDTNSLRMNTSEIVHFKSDTKTNGVKLLSLFEEFNIENKIELAYSRIDVNNRMIREIMLDKKFYQAEFSYEIIKNNLQKYENKLPVVTLIAFDGNQEKLNEIKSISKNSFDFSRFHDDVNIDITLARNRYWNWIDDLVSQKKEIYYIESKNKIIGIHVQDIVGKNANLILTGSAKGTSEISLPLWHSALLNLKSQGVEKCTTLISSSNIGVLNLYIYFQFKITTCLIGYHKKYNNDNPF
jgi:hypothetical protein